jgi:hypothetical protein
MSLFITRNPRATPTCPVDQAGHDNTNAWLNELPALLWRHAGLGITQDVGQMDLADLRGVYQYLSQL